MKTNTKINTVFILADIINALTLEILSETQLKFDFKRSINIILRETSRLVKYVDNTVSPESANDFGEESDKIREMIEAYIESEEE